MPSTNLIPRQTQKHFKKFCGNTILCKNTTEPNQTNGQYATIIQNKQHNGNERRNETPILTTKKENKHHN